MCMQCVAGASVTAAAAATGLRAWLAVHQPGWMTGRRMKLATFCLLAAAVIAAGVQAPGNKPGDTTGYASAKTNVAGHANLPEGREATVPES
jgi:hypothetical protein